MIRLGHVCDCADEEHMGRIKVEYLNHESGAESDWASMASPFAGDGAGLFVMPENGDLVAVGFVGNDVDQPIILGALWSGSQKAPAEDPAERRFVSRKGHSVTLSDGDDDGITIEDSHENKIVMNKDGITISTNGELKISAKKIANISSEKELTIVGDPIQLNPE